MGGRPFCSIIEFKGSFIIVVEEDVEEYSVIRSTSPKSEPYVGVEEFFEFDDSTIPPAAKEAVEEFLEKEEEQRMKLLAKIRVGGKMYPSTKAYFDDHFNRVIDAVVNHPKFKKKVGRG